MDIAGLDDLKVALDLFRTAIGAGKDALGLLPDGGEREAATQTLEEAGKAAQIVEATIAQALGYELCKCEIPPIPMLKIGYMMPHGGRPLTDVYECPRCEQTTAGSYMFERKIDKKPQHPRWARLLERAA